MRGEITETSIAEVPEATAGTLHASNSCDEMSTSLNDTSETIIGSAIQVHRVLGPGLLESAYEACLAMELIAAGLYVEREKPLALTYRGHRLDCGYRLDPLVNESLVVEVKSVERSASIHSVQLLSYLRLSNCSLGLLINFNVRSPKDGIRRVVNRCPEDIRLTRGTTEITKC